MVEEIDLQDGRTSKWATFHVELIDLKCDSRVGYVPSKLASQIADDDQASQRQIMPVVTQLTVVSDADAQERDNGAEKFVCVDWNKV